MKKCVLTNKHRCLYLMLGLVKYGIALMNLLTFYEHHYSTFTAQNMLFGMK